MKNLPVFKNPYLLLGLILLLHTAAWILLKPIAPNGPSDDPFQYAFNANSLINHSYHPDYLPYPNRFGVFVPVSLIFRLFGENPYSTSLWPLIASLLTIALVFFFLNKFADTAIASVAAFLIAVNIEQVSYSLELYPDLIVSFYAFAAVLLLYYGPEQSGNKILSAALFVLTLVLGFLTKETILLLVPFILLCLITDIIQKKHFRFWKLTIVFSLLSLVFLFGFYYRLTGDPFYRIKSMLDLVQNRILDTDMSKSITDVNSSNLLIWLNHKLAYLFLLLFSIPMLISCIKKKTLLLETYISIYSAYLFVLLAVIFHTPKMGIIYMQDRHWMFLIAPLAVLSASFICRPDKKFLWFLIPTLLILCIYNYFEMGSMRALLFFLFLAICLILYFVKQGNYKLLTLPFLFLLVYFVWSNSNYRLENASRSMKIQNQK